jgi:hypothetical protein
MLFMEKQNRRVFLQTSVTVLGAGFVPSVSSYAESSATSAHSGTIHAPAIAANQGKKPLRLGLIVAVGNDPDSAMAKVRDLGLPTAQIFVEEFRPGLDGRLRQALDMHHIEATSVVVGGPVRKSGIFTTVHSPSGWFLARHEPCEWLTSKRLLTLHGNAVFPLSKLTADLFPKIPMMLYTKKP